MVIATIAVLACACGARTQPVQIAAPSPPTWTLTILGTSDLHGHLAALPILGGYVANVRAARARDGGRVLLVDAGDLFQGTLESNLLEGAPVIAGYNALGYAAAAVGNHEFDYGPVGPTMNVLHPGDDLRGALRARVREARFPFLSANLVDQRTGSIPNWDNLAPSTVVTLGTVRVALVGVTTESTPRATAPDLFRGLAVQPLGPAIVREARRRRAEGASVVVLLAHAGAICHRFDTPNDVSSCERDAEIFDLVRSLPEGTVDAVVAGHTHAGVAHTVAGVPIVESYSDGRAFGRIDLTMDRATGRPRSAHVFAPVELCTPLADAAQCVMQPYEGLAITPDAQVLAVVAPALDAAASERDRLVKVDVHTAVRRAYHEESPLGNLVADLLRAASNADVAMGNAGGLRADLPAGQLRFGALYEALPFDNRLVRLRVRGRTLRSLVAHNLESDRGMFSFSGMLIEARCHGADLEVLLRREDGNVIDDNDVINLATTDFLASGGDGTGTEGTSIEWLGPPARDVVEQGLRARQPLVQGAPALFDPAHPRWQLPSARPVHCGQ